MIHSCVRARLALPVTASLLKHPLQSHPANLPPPGLRVEVSRLPAEDPARPLRLRFELRGELDAVRLPEPLDGGAPRRTDGLWRHTCFEAFVAAPAGPGSTAASAASVDTADSVPYVEFNLAPSGAWAIYRFDGYRAGMRPEPAVVEPRIVARRQPGALVVDVALAWPSPLPGLPATATAPVDAATVVARFPVAATAAAAVTTEAAAAATTRRGAGGWRGRLGLTAVVEAADGSLSYWALHHPAARADFHNGGGFALGIEVPE